MITVSKADAISDRAQAFDAAERNHILGAILHFTNGIEANKDAPNSYGLVWLAATELALEFGGYEPLAIPKIQTWRNDQ